MQPERRIVVVGSANIDLVTRVPRAPKPAESVIGHSFSTVTGGKGANQAVAAARLGAEVTFIGCVGNDVFGEQQLRSLTAAGVNVEHVQVHPTEATGTAVILVADEGQNSIVVTPSANFGLRPEMIDAARSVFEGADAVLLQLEIPLDTVAAALDIAKAAGALSIVDAGPAQPVAPGLLRAADMVSPNETEAEAITGMSITSIDEARACAARLQALGARETVLKLGALGCLYLGAEEVYASPFKVRPVDTTAAGDAFTAALALRWGVDPPLVALRFANAVGALATLTHGAQPAMPTLETVQRFLAESEQ